jgi:heterodisulfide reductase subunit A2
MELQMTGTQKGITVWFEEPELLKQKRPADVPDTSYEKIPVGQISSRTFTTHVIPDLCGDCIFCESACPNLKFNKEQHIMEVNPVGCRGCGVCLPACPTSALQQRNCYLGRIERDIHALLGQKGKEIPVACNYCPVVVGELPKASPEGKTLRLVCTGRFEPALVVEALAKGYSRFLLIGCLFEGYPFEKDLEPTRRAIETTKELLRMLGLSQDRFIFVEKYASDKEVGQCLSAQNLIK